MSLTVPDKLNSRLSLNGAILFGGPGTLTRQLPYFAGSQYATLNWTAAGNGSIEIPYSTTVTGSAYDLVNGIGVTAGDVFSTPATVTDILVDGSSAGLGGAAPNDGKVHTVKFVFDSGITLTHLGQNGASGNFFTGHIFSLTLTDLDTPSNSVAYGLNSGSTTTESPTVGTGDLTYQNFVAADWGNYTYQTNIVHDAGTIAAAWVGPELIYNPTCDVNSAWGDTGTPSATVTAGGIVFDGTQVNYVSKYPTSGTPTTWDGRLVPPPGPLLLQFTISEITQGALQLKSTDGGGYKTAAGTYTAMATASGTHYTVIQADAGPAIGTVTHASAKTILELA